jgi:hypothetical protein
MLLLPYFIQSVQRCRLVYLRSLSWVFPERGEVRALILTQFLLNVIK